MQAMATAVPVAIGQDPTSGVSMWIWLLLVVAGSVATVTDMQAMRIPNWLTLPLFAAGLCYALLAGGTSGLYESLAGAAAAGALFVAAYAMLGGGAGDAKLMLAFGSWLGFEASITLLVCVTAVGFLFAVAVVVSRSGVREIPGVIFVSIIRTLGGLALIRKGLFVGATAGAASSGGPSPNAGPSQAELSNAATRPKGWLPYAPAILLGTVCAWIVLDAFGGFPRIS